MIYLKSIRRIFEIDSAYRRVELELELELFEYVFKSISKIFITLFIKITNLINYNLIEIIRVVLRALQSNLFE